MILQHQGSCCPLLTPPLSAIPDMADALRRGVTSSEEQLGVPTRLHELTAPPAELALTGNPASPEIRATDHASVVVQATAVPIEHAPALGCDDPTARIYSVLSRHFGGVLSCDQLSWKAASPGIMPYPPPAEPTDCMGGLDASGLFDTALDVARDFTLPGALLIDATKVDE